MPNSGARVPGQLSHLEDTEEARVAKPNADTAAANIADVGTPKKNDMTMRHGSGGDGSTSSHG